LSNKIDYPLVWEKYAPVYDLMSRNNPSYDENIESLIKRLGGWDLGETPRVIDIGAGTGNFIEAFQPFLPAESEIVHLDFNPAMNKIAKKKYDQAGFANVNLVEDYIQRVDFPENHFDLIICIHALYAMHPQTLVLGKMTQWLKPTGKMFLIDLGRKQDWIDWAWYIYRSMIKRQGFYKATKEAINFVQVARQNYLLTKGQEAGAYATHTTEEFELFLESHGLKVEEIGRCYRGYSDVAICSRKKIEKKVELPIVMEA
jgi:ubiquinone/menaquinone biosynthesis C-methylase UbiE